MLFDELFDKNAFASMPAFDGNQGWIKARDLDRIDPVPPQGGDRMLEIQKEATAPDGSTFLFVVSRQGRMSVSPDLNTQP